MIPKSVSTQASLQALLSKQGLPSRMARAVVREVLISALSREIDASLYSFRTVLKDVWLPRPDCQEASAFRPHPFPTTYGW